MNGLGDKPTGDCFSDPVLREFGSGRLHDVGLMEQVADHLQSCQSCEDRLIEMQEPLDPVIQMLAAADPCAGLGNFRRLDESLVSTKSRLNNKSWTTETGEHISVLPLADGLPIRIERYFVIGELGSGGFAQVFLAKDTDQDRHVAIKVARPDRLATDKVRDLFLREARTAAGLDHPHIVPVYDCRQLDDGRCIVVMKYIDGHTLEDEMKSEGFGPRRAAKLLAAIAGALHYAHRKGVCHRDVKPANILIDRRGTPFLADFGLALQADRQTSPANELAGTYPYMSPEQIRRETRRLDGRTDIWSVGVILYELLTRRRPFAGDSLEQLREEILRHQPKPLRLIDETIPRRLEQVCLKCLKKDVEDRYSTAAELAAALHGRRVGLLPMAGALTACLLLALVLAVAASRPASQQRPATENEIVDVTRQYDQWTPFLDREPMPVVRNILNQFNAWRPMPEQGRFDVRSGADTSIAVFGELEARHFRLRTRITLDRWQGYAGLVFGLHDLPQARPGTRRRCYAVRVGRMELADTPTLEISEFELESPSGTAWRVSSKRGIASGFMPLRLDRSAQLEIHVGDGRLVEVRVDDQPVPLSRDPLLSWPLARSTQFGLTSIGESCVFEEGFVMPLTKE